jgi:hypothetical protein
MFYGHQQFPVIKRMSDFERQYAYDAVRAVIHAEHLAAKAAKDREKAGAPPDEEE